MLTPNCPCRQASFSLIKGPASSAGRRSEKGINQLTVLTWAGGLLKEVSAASEAGALGTPSQV